MKKPIIVHPIEITAENLIARFGKTKSITICHIEESEDECIFLELSYGAITGINFMLDRNIDAVNEHIDDYKGIDIHLTEIFNRIRNQHSHLPTRKQLTLAVSLYVSAFIVQEIN